MIEKFKKIFSDPEIIKHLAFTILILFVFKICTFIPVPLIDINGIRNTLRNNDFLTILNTFSGGGLSSFSILSLGISPYITASIIVQMLQMVIPTMKDWQEMGEVGKAKANRVTRYLTVVIALIQALALLLGLGTRFENLFWVKAFPVNWFYLVYMAIVITAGSAFTMWLADLITQHGVGNGSSMIICAGIVASIPKMFATLNTDYLGSNASAGNIAKFVSIIVIYVLMILGIVYFEAAKRKIPVQYANRQGTDRSEIPLKLNSSGVMPVIFAQTLLSIPTTIVGMMGLSTSTNTGAYWIDQIFSTTKPIGMLLYILMMIFFAYFYSFLTIDPDKMGDNLSKQNAFVPGFKPGEETKAQISNILFRVTTIGAIGITLVALVPIIVQLAFGASSAVTMGGTSLLIIVGVAIETANQIETEAENKESYQTIID